MIITGSEINNQINKINQIGGDQLQDETNSVIDEIKNKITILKDQSNTALENEKKQNEDLQSQLTNFQKTIDEQKKN